MKSWICTKCGETAISKCVSQRSVFPSDEMAAIYSQVYVHDVQVGERGLYVEGQCKATVTLGYETLASRQESEAMRDWDEKWVPKPSAPICRIPPKPAERKWPSRREVYEMARERVEPSYGCYYDEDYSRRLRDQVRLINREIKDLKAAYEHDLRAYEKAVFDFQCEMQEYEHDFKAWQQYEQAHPYVWQHNQEAAKARKEYFIRHLKTLLDIKDEHLTHWLCAHDWVLRKGEGDTCSLGCQHRTED